MAFEDYNQAINCDPNYAIAYNNRGYIYLLRSQYDLAIEDFNKAIELNPEYTKPYLNKGTAYEKQQQYQEAIDTYKMLLTNVLPKDTQSIQNAKTRIRALGGTV